MTQKDSPATHRHNQTNRRSFFGIAGAMYNLESGLVDFFG